MDVMANLMAAEVLIWAVVRASPDTIQMIMPANLLAAEVLIWAVCASPDRLQVNMLANLMAAEVPIWVAVCFSRQASNEYAGQFDGR